MNLESLPPELRAEWYQCVTDPIRFVVKFLGVTRMHDHQAEVLQALAVGYRLVSMRSGRQVGKTALLAWITMWYEMFGQDRKTLVTAPSASQLNDAYTPEFRKWRQRLPGPLAERWDVRAERFDYRYSDSQGFENFITVKTARKDSPESMQGINARGGTLVAVDEASGVYDTLFESLSGSMANDNSIMVLTGNPNRDTGYFADTHTTLADQWYTLKVSSEDVDTVSRQWIHEMETKYGRNSNAFRIHVLGEFPIQEDNTVIKRELIVAASVRDYMVETDKPIVWGLDVAHMGDDASVLCCRQGNTVHWLKDWRNLEQAQLAGAIKAEWDALELDPERRPQEILVDSIGIGLGIVSLLRQFNLPVRGINVGESPSVAGHYRNLKAELWDKARAWFEKRDCVIPEDPKFIEELSVVRKDFTPDTGKMMIETKKQLASRGVKSPDKADAFVLTFASFAASAIHGFTYDSRKPIKRNLQTVV